MISVLIILFASMAFAEGPEPAPVAERLGDAEPNTWVKIDEVDSGGRNSPIFFYDPHQEGIFLIGGTPGGVYGRARRHFEVEFFNPATGQWANVYPPDAPWEAATGVTDAPDAGQNAAPLREVDGITRLGMFTSAYRTDSRAHFQWAYAPESRKLFAYLFNKTIAYDTAERTWTDTGAEPFSKGNWAMVWGNMCYDPINNEIVSIGGSSEEKGGTPGTWVYSIEDNAWRKINPGSDALNASYARATSLRRNGWALLSAARSRYFVTESAVESEVRLSERAAALDADVREFADALADAELAESENTARTRALSMLAEARSNLETVAPKLDDAISPETIAELKGVFDAIEAAELALAPEPTGRAHSQPVFDAESEKIVLFGGSGLDRSYADTWLYDPRTRTWEQRYPEVSPSPRAGHALVYLPDSGRIALAGGYTIDGGFREIPHQVWTYDVGANEWKPLLSLPLTTRGRRPGPSENAPRGGVGGNWSGGGSHWAGAALPDDTLVMVNTFTEGRVTWAMRVDPNAPAADTEDLPGVPPGTMSSSSRPATWEQDQPAPDPEQVKGFYDNLEPNVWTALNPPRGVNHRAWNTTAYDPDRHQFLWWGGGHVTYMGTDVGHYSVRANRWTIGYPPDQPTEPTGGFYVKAALSFQDRPQIPVHAYQAYAYDPPSGKMFYLNRAYNVAERQWNPRPYPGLRAAGAMRTLLETTPQGVVALSQHGLFRFNAEEETWEQLPWDGPAFGQAWCDGHGLCYDSKRNGLWMANEEIFFYDLETGKVEKHEVERPARLGRWALWREQVHIPDADLILLMRRFDEEQNITRNIRSGVGSHIAFDPNEKKYYSVDLDFEGGNPRELGWSAALHYDPELGVALLHDGSSGVWALRFDRGTARMQAIEE